MAFTEIRVKTLDLHQRYKPFLPALMFLAGTLFDILTLDKIDHKAMLLLGLYLILVALLLAAEIAGEDGPLKIPKHFEKIWHHREEATHFFLGNMLSAFTVLYFKSASHLGSLIFFALIAGLLIGNEFSGLRRLGLIIRTILFAVCLTSYLACVTPVWWGRIGFLPFATSIMASGAIFLGMLYLLRRGLLKDRDLLLKRLIAPYGGTLGLFLLFYILHVIPPVPLSLTHIGIYHNIERVKGGYKATSTRPKWKFWQHGDQSFESRPGDKIYCFFSIFSPGGFRDSVKIRWLYKDQNGSWQGSDAVPVGISGGRYEGYRGFAFKANFKPGDWQVRIETSDEREIGRINLTVEAASPTEPPVEARSVVL